MCAASPPAPPDYAGAATAQGAANKEAAVATAQASNPNINSPAGQRRVTWTVDPQTGNSVPTITDEYSPDQREIYDLNQQGQKGLAQVGLNAVGKIGGILGQDVNFDQALGTQAEGRQSVIDSLMRRYDADLGRRKDQVASDLIARGIPQGSEAWNTEMELLDRGRNDALAQATGTADSRAMDERRQAITELLAQRQTPLNEISALRSGSQIAPLQFQNYTGANVQAAPIFQAAQAQGQAGMDAYNAEAASSDAMMSGLFKLGAASMGGAKPWFL